MWLITALQQRAGRALEGRRQPGGGVGGGGGVQQSGGCCRAAAVARHATRPRQPLRGNSSQKSTWRNNALLFIVGEFFSRSPKRLPAESVEGSPKEFYVPSHHFQRNRSVYHLLKDNVIPNYGIILVGAVGKKLRLGNVLLKLLLWK